MLPRHLKSYLIVQVYNDRYTGGLVVDGGDIVVCRHVLDFAKEGATLSVEAFVFLHALLSEPSHDFFVFFVIVFQQQFVLLFLLLLLLLSFEILAVGGGHGRFGKHLGIVVCDRLLSGSSLHLLVVRVVGNDALGPGLWTPSWRPMVVWNLLFIA